jgi:hypothetical protein
MVLMWAKGLQGCLDLEEVVLQWCSKASGSKTKLDVYILLYICLTFDR